MKFRTDSGFNESPIVELVLISYSIIARPPGSANFILDGTSLDDIYLSAWQISSANFSRIAGILANGSFPVNATVDPLGKKQALPT